MHICNIISSINDILCEQQPFFDSVDRVCWQMGDS